MCAIPSKKHNKIKYLILQNDPFLWGSQYRSNGLTSVREDINSPTSNLESLRLLVSFAQSWILCIYGADVSTAFLYSPLDSVEIISLPTTTVGANGDRLYVQLQKALYGLRRAPFSSRRLWWRWDSSRPANRLCSGRTSSSFWCTWMICWWLVTISRANR